jgi:hypothetical protein
VPRTTDGLSGLAGLERQLSPEVVVSALGGYAWWQSAPGRALARVTLDAALPTGSAIGFRLDYGPFLTWSSSYEGLVAGLDATNLRSTIWQSLGERFGVFGYAETTFVGDGNTRFAVGGSGECLLAERYELAVGVAADFVAYSGRSPLYYDPSSDVSAGVFGRGAWPLLEGAELFGELSVGAGHAADSGVEGFGLNYGVLGGLRVERGGLFLEVSGGRNQSQRASVYTSYHAGGTLGLEF